MAKILHTDRIFYGTTTVGEKGQVVIPAPARLRMGLKKGEQLLVFAKGTDMLALSKISNLKRFASHLEGRLGAVRKIIRKLK